MNCREFQEILHDVARDEGLEVAALKDAIEHAEVCSSCDELLGQAEELNAALHSLKTRYACEETPVRVENALIQSFLSQRSARRRSVKWYLAGAASAAGIAALVLFAFPEIWHARALPTGPLFRPALSSVLSAKSVMSAKSTGDTSSSRLRPYAAVNPPADWSAALGDSDKAALPFVPLSETFDPASLDDDTVVRVVLSRAALDSFGVHLDAPKDDEIASADRQVVADLIVTNDGTPQAIRVVGW